MASAFGHALAAIAMGTSFRKTIRHGKFWLLGVACSILPDADVISFSFGIPYESFWGHRGFTHSILFSLLFGYSVAWLFYKKRRYTSRFWMYAAFFAVCTLSHALLDAMTTGGLGVAFFAPFDNSRYFLPWRPIQVSPIGAAKFFSEKGWKVIQSEAVWIGLPSVALMLFNRWKWKRSEAIAKKHV